MDVHSPCLERTDLGIAGFEWDEGNRDKCRKHGVSIVAVESLFHRPFAVFPDPAHSGIEERFKAIGWTDDERAVLIVFTLRKKEDGTFVRPISARYMHRKEVEHYEKEVTKAGKR